MAAEKPRFNLGCAFFDQLPHRYVNVDGEWVVEIDVSDDMRGPGGSVHGGLVSMLVDVAAAASLARATGRPVATASTSIQFLAAGRAGPLRATGTVLRASEALGVVDVKIVDVGRDNRLLAAAHVTLRFLSGEGYVRQT